MKPRIPGAGERELLRGSVRDPAAFEELFARHAVAMQRWLAAHVSDVSTANDLLAETFAAAWLGRRRFRGEDDAAALAWLYGIARNLLHQHYRRGRVEAAARHKLGMSVEAPGEDDLDAVLARAVASSAAGDLERALRQLPATQRAAVDGRVVRELSYEELAAELACSEQNARSYVSRGLRTLNTILKGVRP